MKTHCLIENRGAGIRYLLLSGSESACKILKSSMDRDVDRSPEWYTNGNGELFSYEIITIEQWKEIERVMQSE